MARKKKEEKVEEAVEEVVEEVKEKKKEVKKEMDEVTVSFKGVQKTFSRRANGNNFVGLAKKYLEGKTV